MFSRVDISVVPQQRVAGDFRSLSECSNLSPSIRFHGFEFEAEFTLVNTETSGGLTEMKNKTHTDVRQLQWPATAH